MSFDKPEVAGHQRFTQIAKVYNPALLSEKSQTTNNQKYKFPKLAKMGSDTLDENKSGSKSPIKSIGKVSSKALSIQNSEKFFFSPYTRHQRQDNSKSSSSQSPYKSSFQGKSGSIFNLNASPEQNNENLQNPRPNFPVFPKKISRQFSRPNNSSYTKKRENSSFPQVGSLSMIEKNPTKSKLGEETKKINGLRKKTTLDLNGSKSVIKAIDEAHSKVLDGTKDISSTPKENDADFRSRAISLPRSSYVKLSHKKFSSKAEIEGPSLNNLRLSDRSMKGVEVLNNESNSNVRKDANKDEVILGENCNRDGNSDYYGCKRNYHKDPMKKNVDTKNKKVSVLSEALEEPQKKNLTPRYSSKKSGQNLQSPNKKEEERAKPTLKLLQKNYQNKRSSSNPRAVVKDQNLGYSDNMIANSSTKLNTEASVNNNEEYLKPEPPSKMKISSSIEANMRSIHLKLSSEQRYEKLMVNFGRKWGVLII